MAYSKATRHREDAACLHCRCGRSFCNGLSATGPRQDQLEAIIARWKLTGLVPHDALPEKDPLAFLVHEDVKSIVAAGYKFGIEPEAISCLLVGTGNVAHLEENVATVLGSPLPREDSARIRGLFASIAETEWDPN